MRKHEELLKKEKKTFFSENVKMKYWPTFLAHDSRVVLNLAKGGKQKCGY
jgi:hypothetical protein